MPRRGEVLVAILNNQRDMEILSTQHWYRIPVESVEKYLKPYWAPEWLAFYQTKAFGQEAYMLNYYARVLNIQQLNRKALLPHESNPELALKQYYKLDLTPLQKLAHPIVSERQRRILFIPTTLPQLMTATTLKDLLATDQSRLQMS
jgi:hypothetical protein